MSLISFCLLWLFVGWIVTRLVSLVTPILEAGTAIIFTIIWPVTLLILISLGLDFFDSHLRRFFNWIYGIEE